MKPEEMSLEELLEAWECDLSEAQDGLCKDEQCLYCEMARRLRELGEFAEPMDPEPDLLAMARKRVREILGVK